LTIFRRRPHALTSEFTRFLAGADSGRQESTPQVCCGVIADDSIAARFVRPADD
jgi:hypothetical protein